MGCNLTFLSCGHWHPPKQNRCPWQFRSRFLWPSCFWTLKTMTAEKSSPKFVPLRPTQVGLQEAEDRPRMPGLTLWLTCHNSDPTCLSETHCYVGLKGRFWVVWAPCTDLTSSSQLCHKVLYS